MPTIRRFGLSLLCALGISAVLAAQAPPRALVADAASKGDLNAVRTLLKQGADVNTPRGDGMTALHWAAERGDAALAEMLIYAGANVVGRHAHRPVHAAAPRRPQRQRGRRQGAAQRRRGPVRADAHQRRDAAAPGGRSRQRRRRDGAPRQGRRRQREGIRVGPDAAHLRRRVEPRGRDQAARPARREGRCADQVGRSPEAVGVRSAGLADSSARSSRRPCRRARRRRRRRCRRRFRRRVSSTRRARPPSRRPQSRRARPRVAAAADAAARGAGGAGAGAAPTAPDPVDLGSAGLDQTPQRGGGGAGGGGGAQGGTERRWPGPAHLGQGRPDGAASRGASGLRRIDDGAARRGRQRQPEDGRRHTRRCSSRSSTASSTSRWSSSTAAPT